MSGFDTNIFDDMPNDAAVEIGKAREQIAQTLDLLKKTEDMPTPEDVGRARSTAALVMKAANELVVNDEATFAKGNELARLCTQAITAVEKPETGSPMAKVQEQKENAHKLHKFFTELVGSLADPYRKAKAVVDGKVKKFQREETERRRIEAEVIRAAQEKRLTEEKLRLAADLEAKGDMKAADRVLDEPVIVEPVVVVAVKAEGRVYVHNWKAEVGDLMALVKAVALGTTSITFLQANMTALNAQAASLKGALAIPGVKAFDDGFYRG